MLQDLLILDFCESHNNFAGWHPFGATSAMAFFVAAAVVYRAVHRQGTNDPAMVGLIIAIALMGVGAIALHVAPSKTTLLLKFALWTLFTAWSFAMVLARVFGCSLRLVMGHILALGMSSLFVVTILPPRLFGMETFFIAPLISLYVLGCICVLEARYCLKENARCRWYDAAEDRRHFAMLNIGYLLLIAGMLLAAGYVARAYDRVACTIAPSGMVFVWNLFVAATVTCIGLALTWSYAMAATADTATGPQAHPQGRPFLFGFSRLR